MDLPTFDPKHWKTIRRITYVVLVAICVIVGGFVWTGPVHTFAVQMIAETPTYAVSSTAPLHENRTFMPLEASIPEASFTALDLVNHPDSIHGEYTSAPLVTLGGYHNLDKKNLKAFRDLLNIYELRQAEDDNFTVRVIDKRTSGLLERYTLENVRRQYEATGMADWEEIDVLRSQESSRLIGKYRRRGVPMEDIMIKWGRLDQVKKARERDLPFIEYEVNLSQTLGLSLLATELGTVETFNSDKMVSTVGARGRYQMMPYMLRRFDIYTYNLWTRFGQTVEVREEWHPLITMEPAFTIIKGYGNAVGHEIPGISAYHTGPFNIFFIYNMYLQHEQEQFSPASTVMDAYLWAITDGFDLVSEDTGFRQYSRSYVATAYGSFKGTEHLPVDTTKTHLTEQVQTRLNTNLYLSELIDALTPISNELDWSFASKDTSLYNRFRLFNPHIDLPEPTGDRAVPKEGDVFLTTRNTHRPVRFFLPLGAAHKLKEHGFDVFSMEHLFQFDHGTYTVSEEDITVWDRQYAALVDDIKYFGFTRENRDQLNILVERFQKLAESNPTNYRRLQLRIIELHQNLWRTRYWSDLANNTAAHKEELLPKSQSPSSPIGLTQRISFTHSDPVELAGL